MRIRKVSHPYYGALLRACVAISCTMPTVLASAQTTSLCIGLRTILSSTETKYRELRGTFDSAMNEYRGKLLPTPMTTCFTYIDTSGASYECQQSLPDDEEQARLAFDELVVGVKQCFGADVRSIRSSKAERAEFRSIAGGESIKMHFRRHVSKYAEIPPKYVLYLRIEYVELNQ